MNLRISGKHMDIGEAFRSRIEGRIAELVDKYFDGGFSGHVVVERAGSRFSADCMIHLDTGILLQAGGEAQEPMPAFDTAADRIEKRLRRYKRRLKSHKAAGNGAASEAAYGSLAAPEPEREAEDFAPAIVAEATGGLRPMTVASAALELDLNERPVLLFRNADNGEINVVYRRADGNIGWIDPAMATPGQG